MTSSLQQGINAAKAGQTEKALEFLKDAIIEEPQNADVWVWVAAIIEDPEKQAVFLNKALEIDPHNIPAQRGLGYLQKQNQQNDDLKGETLLDHTQPISPFPNKAGGPNQQQTETINDRRSDALANLPAGGDKDSDEPVEKPQKNQHLTALEIILLCVVVIVFAFIGLLTSSALLDFELPWGNLTGSRPRLTNEPPYPGVFLYEEEVFYNMEAHAGPPVANVGIPTSASTTPVILFWNSEVDMNHLNLIHESGTYLNYRAYQAGRNGKLVQPSNELQAGLYCFQQTQQQPPASLDTYYCFQVDLSIEE